MDFLVPEVRIERTTSGFSDQRSYLTELPRHIKPPSPKNIGGQTGKYIVSSLNHILTLGKLILLSISLIRPCVSSCGLH